MTFFFIAKSLWEYVFYNAILCTVFFVTDHLNKVRTKLKNVTKVTIK